MLQDTKCPLCGGEIISTTRSYSCENWKREDGGCQFCIWKEAFGALFDENDAEALIAGKTVQKYNISKKGNPYLANWKLDSQLKMHYTYVDRGAETDSE